MDQDIMISLFKTEGDAELSHFDVEVFGNSVNRRKHVESRPHIVG